MSRKNQESAPYYNIAQLRVNYWKDLKNHTAELVRCHKGSENEKKHIKLIQDIIKLLKGVEHYFAFPGVKRIDYLGGALAKQEYTSLANARKRLR